jgi:hypothetical protein
MRIVLQSIAAMALTLFVFWEVGVSYPVAGWLYLILFLFFCAGIFYPGSSRPAVVRGVALAVIGLVIGALHQVDWTSRKPFLRDFARIRAGMTEAEVRQIMTGYLVGTGWPALPLDPAANSAGRPAPPAHELTLRNSIVFRHSNDGRFNSDWGIVRFSQGKVAETEFSPD